MHTGATIQTSPIPALDGATETISTSDGTSNDIDAEYGLEVNFWKTKFKKFN